MRLGATLAAAQAAAPGSSGPFSSLVCWDPCLSGRTFLREGEALYGFGETALETPDDGLRHTPGFQYDAATAKELRALDLGKIPADRPLADHVLLLTRVDRPVLPGIVDRLEQERLETGPATGQGQLLDVPPELSVVPEDALRQVVDWLTARVDDQPAVPVKAPDGRAGGAGRLRPRRVRARARADHPARPRRHRRADGRADRPGRAQPDRAGAVGGPGQRGRRAPHRARSALGRVGQALGRLGLPRGPHRPERRRGQPDAGRAAWTTGPSRRSGSTTCATSSPSSPRTAPRWASSGSARAPTRRSRSRCGSTSTRSSRSTRGSRSTPRPRAHRSTPTAGGPRCCRTSRSPGSRVRHRILAGGLWRIYRELALWHAPLLVLRRVLRRGTAVEVIACPDDAQHFTEVYALRPLLWWMRRSPRFRFAADPVPRPLAPVPTRPARRATSAPPQFLDRHLTCRPSRRPAVSQ